ncbi:MAG TPA: AsmA family protein, partial [Longimicrobiales bacterium]
MRKRFLIAAAVLVALPVLLLGIAAFALPSEAVARRVAEQAEARLGREVTIGDVGVSLLPLGVSLDDIAVAGPAPDAPAVISLGELLLRPRLLPLLRGRIEVDELRLTEPRIAIVVDSAGVSNLPAIEPDTAAAPSTASVAFDVRDIRIVRGVITLDDASTGRALRLDGIDETLLVAGDVRDGQLADIRLAGALAVDSIALRLPGDDDWTSRGVRLAVDHDARLRADSGTLHLDSLRVQIQEVVLRGAGTVRGLTATDSVRVLDLRFDAEPFDVAQLVASLPARFTAKLRDEQATLGGTAALHATVQGPLAVDTMPAVAGVLTLADVSAARAGQSLVAGLGGDVVFANDSIATTALAGSALGEPFHLSFSLRQPADPIVRFDVNGAVRLQTLSDAGLLPDSAPAMQGRVHAALAGTMQPSSVAASRVAGTVTIQDFTTTTAKGQAVGVRAATLGIAGDTMRIAPATVGIAGQTLTLAASVTDWMARAFGDTTHLPLASFEVRGRKLDLEPVLGPAPTPTFSQLVFARLANAQVDGRAAEAIAAERGAAPPKLP